MLPCPRRCGVFVLSGLLAGFASCKKAEPVVSVAAPPAEVASSVSQPAPMPAALPDAVRKLFGRWLRVDGGYVLELRGGDLSGVLQAGYFNPKSINVSRAVWMQGGAGLQVAVELTDVGYPGATYVLTYDAQADRLAGQYKQPAMQQSFEVEFVRQPKP